MDDEQSRPARHEIVIPRWMPTFADMMTLLVCFFVLLLSFAEMDLRRYKRIADSMAQAFGVQRDVPVEAMPTGTGAPARAFAPEASGPTPISELRQPAAEPPDSGQQAAPAEPAQSLALTEQMKRSVEAEIEATRRDASALAEQLAAEIVKGDVEIETRGRRIIVRIRERGSFASGSAELKPEYKVLMRRFRDVLAAQRGAVAVQGHTDDVPIATARYRSNWELSSARAVSVAEQLLAGGVLDPRRLAVTGFADTRPLGPNDSPAGRARNRRVEIVIDQGIDQRMREQLDVLKTEDPAYYRSLRLDEGAHDTGGGGAPGAEEETGGEQRQ